jgi:CPA2 family monovalent cation:H+ antiporter-2
VYLLARTRYIAELEPLYKLGASEVIPEEFETSIEIFAHVLREFAVPTNVIEQQVALVRAGHYGMLRGRPASREANREWLRWLETSATQTYLLTEGCPFIGQNIRQTDLRARSGVTIVAITRNGEPHGNPPPEFLLSEGDVLVLVGTHRQLENAKSLLTGR